MYTLGGALAEGTQLFKGTLTPGKLADMVLLDADPLELPGKDVKGIGSVATIIGGEVVWSRGV